jgi:hypothetical protein
MLSSASLKRRRCTSSAAASRIDDKGIDFAKRAAAQGIRLQLIVGPQYTPNAPTRPYQPKEFPAVWGVHPLSYADPTLSKTAFQRLFDGLDAIGIELVGVELGNEINWAAFNPESPLPGEGKILSVEDPGHDPERKQIAKGFLQYIKILEVLKDVRDHSRLNKSTPIISAGMVSAEDGAKLSSGMASARPIKLPSANWSVPLTLSAMDSGMSCGLAAFLAAESCGVADFPTAEKAAPHIIRRAAIRKRLILASGIRKKDT